MLKGNRVVGIVREVYNKWERRAPLCPQHVRRLVQAGCQVLVQPSNRRVFTDGEYAAAGATVTDDLGGASVIFGVKQVPVENLLPERTYVFFSHVIKAQPENMELLDHVLENNIRLIDYETINEGGMREANQPAQVRPQPIAGPRCNAGRCATRLKDRAKVARVRTSAAPAASPGFPALVFRNAAFLPGTALAGAPPPSFAWSESPPDSEPNPPNSEASSPRSPSDMPLAPAPAARAPFMP